MVFPWLKKHVARIYAPNVDIPHRNGWGAAQTVAHGDLSKSTK